MEWLNWWEAYDGFYLVVVTIPPTLILFSDVFLRHNPGKQLVWDISVFENLHFRISFFLKGKHRGRSLSFLSTKASRLKMFKLFGLLQLMWACRLSRWSSIASLKTYFSIWYFRIFAYFGVFKMAWIRLPLPFIWYSYCFGDYWIVWLGYVFDSSLSNSCFRWAFAVWTSIAFCKGEINANTIFTIQLDPLLVSHDHVGSISLLVDPSDQEDKRPHMNFTAVED